MLINKIKNKFSNGMKSVAKISSGTMIGQFISLGTLPIFTRIYGPEIMGDWAFISSIAIILNTFSDLGLTNAVMIEEEEKSEILYKVLTTLVFFISFISTIVLGIYYYFFPNSNSMHILWLSIMIFIQTFTQQQIQICYSWLNRKKMYNVLMLNPVINNLSMAIIAIPIGLLGFKRYGYYIGLLVGQIITLLHMKKNLPKTKMLCDISDIKEALDRHKEFVKFQMPANICAQVKNQLPVFLIKGLFGSEMLGYYSITVKVLNIPITLLANAIGKVYYQTVAEMHMKGENIGEYTLRNIQRAMKLAILPMIIILSFSDIVASTVLGSDYIVAGNMCRLIAFNTLFTFLLMATQGIAIILKKQNYSLISTVVQAIGYFITLYIGKNVFNSIYIGCFFMSMIFCVVQIIYFCFIFKACNVKIVFYIKNLFITILIILLGMIVMRLLLFCFGIV